MLQFRGPCLGPYALKPRPQSSPEAEIQVHKVLMNFHAAILSRVMRRFNLKVSDLALGLRDKQLSSHNSDMLRLHILRRSSQELPTPATSSYSKCPQAQGPISLKLSLQHHIYSILKAVQASPTPASHRAQSLLCRMAPLRSAANS